MKKKLFFRSCSTVLMTDCIFDGLITSYSTSKKELPIAERSTNLFYDFTYKSENDFYAFNPLPSKRYFYYPILPEWHSGPSICTNGKEYYFLVIPTVDIQRMALRTPATDFFSPTKTPDYLTLKCADVNSAKKDMPTSVCCRMQHHKYKYTIHILFKPLDEQKATGILLFKDETYQYSIEVNRNKNGKYLTLLQVCETRNNTLVQQPP